MNLAFPGALFWLLLAAPIVIFYILKIRLRRVPVSTVLFWRQIFEEKQPRSIWQHLRHLISLLLQLVFLFLLTFALAEPYFRWEKLEARRLVLIIDNSASMNATDVVPTRLAKAKEEGRRIVSGLRFNDEVAIVAAGTQPQVLCGLTGHTRSLLAALEGVAPSDGPTRVAEAVALGRRLLAEQDNAKVVVITDGCLADAESLAAAPDTQIVCVGQRTGNVGITRFQVRRSLLDPIGYEILAEVCNYSDDEISCRLEIELNGEPIEVNPLLLKTGDKWQHVFERTSAEGGQLVARLNRPDALMSDNEARALLPKREYQPIILVAENNLFVEKVFEANPLVNLSVVPKMPAKIPPGTIVVFHRTVPQTLPAGSVVVIDPANDCNLWKVGEKLQNPIVTKQDKDSPLMAHVRLDNVLMPEARKLAIDGPAHALVSALAGEPLYAAIDRPNGKVLVLTVNLDLGDLPLRTAFPIMMMNSLLWFSGSRGELQEAVSAGSTVDVELPPQVNAGELQLWSPAGIGRRLPDGGGKATIGPLDQCGIWKIAATNDASPVREFACNLSSRNESDIRPAAPLLEKRDDPPLTAGFAGRPLWFYLLITAFALTVVEWCLYQRRTIS